MQGARRLPALWESIFAAGEPLRNATITTIVLSVVIFLVFKGYKVKGAEGRVQEQLSAFTQKQIFTLIGFVVMILVCAIFKRNVGLVSLSVAVVLLLVNAADERPPSKCPWSTLLMVCGVGTLMSVVSTVGGVELMSKRPSLDYDPQHGRRHPGSLRRHPVLVQLCHRRGVAHHGPHCGCHCRAGGCRSRSLITIMCLTASFAGFSLLLPAQPDPCGQRD